MGKSKIKSKNKKNKNTNTNKKGKAKIEENFLQFTNKNNVLLESVMIYHKFFLI